MAVEAGVGVGVFVGSAVDVAVAVGVGVGLEFAKVVTLMTLELPLVPPAL